ncbi:MAG: poly(A) polymerase [Sneathiella sp.]|jgi:poly(A) polymerase
MERLSNHNLSLQKKNKGVIVPQALVDLTKEPPAWLHYKETQSLFAALEQAGGQCRFVGGCVRDALVGTLSDDLDVSTNLIPEDASKRLEKAGFKVVPTGIDHGTITAIKNHRVFEVTTLRIDAETYGRHASVAFTDDWKVDAARRDFTFNALSLDQAGVLHDYFGGQEDLAKGRVRFIGDAEARIQEDYLRILRYFRFFARFGNGNPDKNQLAQIQKNATSLSRLSRERVTKELMLLLGLDKPVPSLKLMKEYGVFRSLFGVDLFPEYVEALTAVEREKDPVARLLALIGGEINNFRLVQAALRLSNKTQQRIQSACETELAADLDPHAQKTALYRLGPVVFKDCAMIGMLKNSSDRSFQEYLRLAETWSVPEFPVKGRDLVAWGMKPGPEIGKAITLLIQIWIDHDFTLTADELRKRL